jgi:hypothetical protein
MRIILLFALLIQVSCATKYILPGNKFMTPESQGGMFNSQAEFQQTSANELRSDMRNASVKDGVINQVIPRTGFAFSTSLLDQMDLFWSHTGGGNSLLGVKFQFLGGSRTSKAMGHKMAFSAAFGGNDYQTAGDNAVEFELKGQEYQFLYGYRFGEMVLLYTNASYARYNFLGTINSSDATINGLEPQYETKVMSLLSGLELGLGSFFGKAECGYQQLSTSYTKLASHFIYGYAMGVSW